MDTNTVAYDTIRKALEDERRMREWVFRSDAKKKELKCAEMTRALAALEVLRAAAGVPDPKTHPKQAGLL